jgi:L-iditol 2-dehydrogenase
MKFLSCPATGRVEVVEKVVPVVGTGELLLKMDACGICGTDLMKVYDPATAKPVQLGHEIAATVAAVGDGVSGFHVGQRVAAAHHAPDYGSHYAQRGSETQDPHFKASNVAPGGFAEFIRIPMDLVPHTVVPVPDHVPTLRAAFMEPLACCIRATQRVSFAEDDTALIVGVGAIGLLFVPLLRHHGVNVIAGDINAEKLKIAKDWGAAETFLVTDDSSATHRLTAMRGVDTVILTATNPATIALALKSVRDGGTIIPFGVKPGMMAEFDFWQIYRREISVVTSYSATPDGLRAAMELLSGPGFELEKTVSMSLPLSRAHEGFEALHSMRASKVVITS